ncbi:MAG: hypothetical protein M0P31_12375 [Solirubrobacteraceae bacterium]|nr:hypothetical protein [Solirubrobacteraceae bacterium]
MRRISAKNLWVKSFNAPVGTGDPYVLGHHLLGHDRQNQFPIHGVVAIEATNTVEGTQRAFVRGIWSVDVDDPTFTSTGPKGGTSDDPSAATVTIDPISIDIPPLTWTPTGDGPIEFRVAEHGNIGDQVTIYGRGYPGRADHNVPIWVRPYGSVFLRPETDAYGLTADCVQGDIEVTEAGIPYSRLLGDVLPGAHQSGLPAGTQTADGSDTGVGEHANPGWVHDRNVATYRPAYGSRGRYTITSDARAPFATFPVATAADGADQTPTRTVTVTVPAPAPPAEQISTNASIEVLSTSLAGRSGSFKLRLRNRTDRNDVGAIRIKTRTAIKVGKRKATRFSVAGTVDYRLKAGQTRTYRIALGTRARQALRGRKSLPVRVTVEPDRAADTTKSLSLRR